MYDLYPIFVLFVSNTKIGRVENKEASCQCVFNCPKVLFVVVLVVVVLVDIICFDIKGLLRRDHFDIDVDSELIWHDVLLRRKIEVEYYFWNHYSEK